MSFLFFFFSPYFVTMVALITLFGNVHRPCKQYSTLSITVYITSILYLSFCLIFWLYLHHLPYLKMCTDHTNSTPMLSTTVYIMSILFFFFFSDFLPTFMLISIFGNAHRLCKQLSNITTPSLFFPDFPPIFHLKLQNFPYLAIFSVHSS